MAELQDIRLAFIAASLKEYMERNVRAMKREIGRQKAKDTGELENSLLYKVYQSHAEGNASLSFALQGRMIDMGVGKGHPLGGGPSKTQELLNARKGGRKPKKVYSPIVYGNLNGLINDLLYGMTKETIANIKQNLDAKNILNT